MINFQDVLRQKKLPYEGFCCDENVYRIAKELQLLLSPKFDNLFIGIDGYHTEKVLLVCSRLFLKDIGVRDIFFNNEIYWAVVADHAIMSGKNYVLSRGAVRNLSEAVNCMRLDKFKGNCPKIFSSVENAIADIWEALKAEDESNKGNLCRELWNAIKEHAEKYKFIEKFSVFNDSMGKNSELWRYLSIFLDNAI